MLQENEHQGPRVRKSLSTSHAEQCALQPGQFWTAPLASPPSTSSEVVSVSLLLDKGSFHMSVSQSCHNKILQTRWLQTKETKKVYLPHLWRPETEIKAFQSWFLLRSMREVSAQTSVFETCKIKVWASLFSPEPSFLGLSMAVFSLCPHLTLSLGMHPWSFFLFLLGHQSC